MKKVLQWIKETADKVEKTVSRRFPVVHADGVSSMIHALIVLASFLVPGFLFGLIHPITGLVVGGITGSWVEYFYIRREISDYRKFHRWFLRGQLAERDWNEKRRDCYRDFGMTIFAYVIGMGILVDKVFG